MHRGLLVLLAIKQEPNRSKSYKANGHRARTCVSTYHCFLHNPSEQIRLSLSLRLADNNREARKAKANGSTRFCMGAAWRDMNGRKTNFKRILEMVKEIKWVEKSAET